MQKNSFNYTRGGQLWAHRMRMFTQVFKISLVCSLSFLLLLLVYKIFSVLTPNMLYLFCVAWWAGVKTEMLRVFFGKSAITISFWNFEAQTWETWQTYQFLSHSYIQNIQRIARYTFSSFLTPAFFQKALWAVLLGFGSTTLFFWFQGRKTQASEFKRGGTLVKPNVLKSLLKRKRKASPLNIDGVPLLKGKETSHILLTGTTSSGKSNCMHTLFPQIQKRRDSGIIVDLTGDFVKRYYRESQDFILNPFDNRTLPWSPWAECKKPSDYDQIAEAFIGTNSNVNDPFWEKSAKIVFAESLKMKSKDRNPLVSEVFDLMAKSSLRAFSKFLKSTKAGPLVDEKGERTTISIRASLLSKIASLEYLEDTKNSFSLKKWIKSDPQDQWVFLSASPEQRESLQPLITTWVNVVIQSLMTLEPDHLRRFWFLIDELPALNKLPSLEKGLAELRKYGGCMMLGTQDVPQLKKIYGHHAAQTILNQANTKIFFRATDPETCRYVSQSLGQKEETNMKENISYGAHSMRDGVSLNEHKMIENLVLPTEVANLQDLECFLRLPGDFPVTKIQMTYKKGKQKAPGFVEKKIRKAGD